MKRYFYGFLAVVICFAVAFSYERNEHLEHSPSSARLSWPSTNFVPLVVFIERVKIYWFFGEKYRLSVNGEVNKKLLSSRALTNRLASLHLQFGDAVVLRKDFDGPVRQWLELTAPSNNVAVSTYQFQRSVPFFTAPVYNWVAPVNAPDTLNNARFFINGISLGNAMDGYQSMLRDIEKRKPDSIIIIGSYYHYGGYGPFNSPFVDNQTPFWEVLKRNGIKLIISPMTLYF